MRRKYKIGSSPDSHLAYHYYLATGLDAGLPFVAADEAKEAAYWRVARSSLRKVELHKKQRPTSTMAKQCSGLLRPDSPTTERPTATTLQQPNPPDSW